MHRVADSPALVTRQTGDELEGGVHEADGDPQVHNLSAALGDTDSELPARRPGSAGTGLVRGAAHLVNARRYYHNGSMTLRLLPYRPDRDAYQLLGVQPTASLDEIGAACRRLARTFHPDHNRSARATQEMQVVNAVRRVMSDPEWRATYDRERRMFRASQGRMPTQWPFDRIDPIRNPSPLMLERPPTSAVARYARAFAIGVRAAAEALMPQRCLRCRTVIDGVDSYCAACGTPLLTTGG